MSDSPGDQKGKAPSIDRQVLDISWDAAELIGMVGRMLYRSKSMRKPTTIFNANIFNGQAKKIWFGDLEIERDREGLLALSGRVGPLFILREMDGRFMDRMPTPGSVRADAMVIVEHGEIVYSREFAEYRDRLTEILARPKRGRHGR